MSTFRFLPALVLCCAVALAGCVSTVGKIITAPVKITSSAIDMATTSQSEADEKRGRAIREYEEDLGKLDRRYQKHLKECDQGARDSCLKARDDYADIQNLQSRKP